jgi:hypothetical protein
MTGMSSGQVACPYCGDPIALSVEAVLGGHGIPCLSCGAEMRVDRANSNEALDLLRRWHRDNEAARRLTQSGKVETPAGGGGSPRRARRPRRPRS